MYVYHLYGVTYVLLLTESMSMPSTEIFRTSSSKADHHSGDHRDYIPYCTIINRTQWPFPDTIIHYATLHINALKKLWSHIGSVTQHGQEQDE